MNFPAQPVPREAQTQKSHPVPIHLAPQVAVLLPNRFSTTSSGQARPLLQVHPQLCQDDNALAGQVEK